ncbi:MAG: hypothetical protein HYZ75_13040 [Elusimicrobia bacterium]|nr:hypothetical protein [Elusimicrobiota bacterium]
MRNALSTAAVLCILALAAHSRDVVDTRPTEAPPAPKRAAAPAPKDATAWDTVVVPPHDLRVQVDASYKSLKDSADLVVTDATQANYVAGSDKPRKGPSGPEFKSTGFTVNILPVVEGDKVSIQLQVELSGFSDADAGERLHWQVQTAVMVKKGVKKTVSNGAGRIDILITDAPDAP